MANEFKTWEEAQKAWNKAIIKWQKEHPDKFWFDELNNVSTESDEGSNPPPPPPPPPHG